MYKPAYKNYLLGVLVLVGAVSIFDRFVFALALEPIKQDLGLSDSQLGLMTGIAFSAFYAIAGIPIARWADRGNRVTISGLAVALCGAMLSLCSMVTSFFQMLLVRAGVAVGEAGAIPSAQSLIPDYFDRVERPRAMAIYFMFYPISMVIGYLAGGWLVENLGWRATFMVIGIPGILVAILVKLTLREPRLTQKTRAVLEQPSILSVLKMIWQLPALRHLFMSFCLGNFFIMGTGQWLGVFFMRSHGMQATELGAWLALIWGVFGILGNYIGGYFAMRYAPNNEKLQMSALSVCIILYGVVSAMAYLAPSQSLALTFLAVSALVGTVPNGPVFSAIQTLINDRVRSTTIALILMFSNLIGLGLGPLALGVLSDTLNPMFGQNSLRYALVIFCPGTLWIAIHYWKASTTILNDIHTNSDMTTLESTELVR